MSQKDLENKLSTIRGIILLKDQGAAKIQGIVERAQDVLANTAPAGHTEINKSITKLQNDWSATALRMLDVKTSLEDSIYEWSDFLNLVQNIKKSNIWLENSLHELSELQATIPEKRAQLDRIKTMEEKVRMEKIEVDALKEKAEEMLASTCQSQAAIQAQVIFDTFDQLTNQAKKLLAEREAQYRDHKLYKEAYDDLNTWIGRAREKFPLVQQVKLDDKSTIENAVVAIDTLMNKKAQGELLIEHLVHRGEVVLTGTSPSGIEIIRNDIRSIRECFEDLFREIALQKHSLQATMNLWRSHKEEYDRLLEWLQQIDILVKNHKLNLAPNIDEKQKLVEHMQGILKKLENAKTNFEEFNKQASGLLTSILSNYVQNQLQHINSMYQIQLNIAKDVLKKLETNYEQHKEYEVHSQKANDWIENAIQVISLSSETSPASSRDDLLERLNQIQTLIKAREEGQALVHVTINTSEKILRNTRSDGRDIINTQIKNLQNDWERTIKKLSSAKVHIETDLLQWADYSSSCDQLQQLITDREAKLQQASEQRVILSRKGQPGLISGLSERKANLRQTNNIVQDIVSLEPMIQSVTSKASGLQHAPVKEISTKYETLSKQAKYIYEKQKETIEHHQALLDAGNEFAQWLRNAKERLNKFSEPTGDKELLATKTSQLKVLESETANGKAILQKVLLQGEIACNVAIFEDREIIEEEVAILQEEFDAYVDALKSAKSYLEVGIVKWTDYQNQYAEALDWLISTEILVQTYAKLEENLDKKKVALEQFQQHLQTLFDWQKELDSLNVKAQTLLEVCSDTRISNGITQITTKYNALLTAAKEVMRRLELQYQEHQQHHALYEECQSWIENSREKLSRLEEMPNTIGEVQVKLNTLKGIRQAFEHGQNKMRYLLELKEKVVINTAGNGATKVQEDTDMLKQDFDYLLEQINRVKHALSNRASQLEDIYKPYKLFIEWLDEVELKIPLIEDLPNDPGEKKLILEKYRSLQRDISGHNDIVEKINAKLAADGTLVRADFSPGLEKFDHIQETINKAVESIENQVNNFEKYKQAYQQVHSWSQQTRLKIEQNSDCHGEKDQIFNRLEALKAIEDGIPENKKLLENVNSLGQQVIINNVGVGKSLILDEIEQLHSVWDSLHALLKTSIKKQEASLSLWNNFLNKHLSLQERLGILESFVEKEPEPELTSAQILEQCKILLENISNEKQAVESLNDACEMLVEHSACARVRDMSNELQSNYTKILTAAQGMLAKAEKSITDQADFDLYKSQMENWIQEASDIVDGCLTSCDLETIEKNINTLTMLNKRIPEGQCLLASVHDCYNKTMGKIRSSNNEPVIQLASLRASWDSLMLTLNEKITHLRQIKNNWIDFSTNMERFEQWLNETEKIISLELGTKGDLSEMKMTLERYKILKTDIERKNVELESLASYTKDLNAQPQIINTVMSKINDLNTNCDDIISNIESEVNECASYYQCLQDVEKWLLQISFLLMAHNSLYVTGFEQVKTQIEQHEALLNDVQKYRSILDDLRQKGKNQISRYEKIPNIENTIEDQLSNIEQSYNSILKTALQIKSRLADVLSKFQEYEDILSSIMKCLEEYEPQIESQLNFQSSNLSSAKQYLKGIQDWNNTLQTQKIKLAETVQMCETATASISRPSSPLEASIIPIPERELTVRAKLEDLIDQVEGQIIQAELQVKKLEELEQQKIALISWISKQKSIVSDFESKPCKLRSDISKQELTALTDLLSTVGDKRSDFMTTLRGALSDEDCENTDKLLDSLETDVMHVIAKKQREQEIIETYRSCLQNIQNWLDSLVKRIDVLDKGCGLTCAQKMSNINAVNDELNLEGPVKLESLLQYSSKVAQVISNLEGQQVSEQIKSVQRRLSDIEKRIMRKAQLFETTKKHMDSIKQEISQLQNIFEDKLTQMKTIAPSDFSSKAADQLEQSIKNTQREVESKQTVIDTIEKRISNMHCELESIEYNQLETCFRTMLNNQEDLIELLKINIGKVSDAAEYRKKFEADVEKANNWLKKKANDIQNKTNHFALEASAIEQEIEANKSHTADIIKFKEGYLNEINVQYINVAKQYPITETVKPKPDDVLEAPFKKVDSLKKELEDKINILSDMFKLRKDLESNMQNLCDWLVGAETSISSKVHDSNLHILNEELKKYKLLAGAAKPFANILSYIVQQAKTVTQNLSNADKLKLAEKLKTLKNNYNNITHKIDDNCKFIEDSMKRKKDAKEKFEECVRILGIAQQRLRNLNRPIGSKIDDVQELFSQYEEILKDLKKNKGNLNELDLNELLDSKAVADQHDDMIKMIEEQLMNLRHLLLLREQFMALVNDITDFIINNAGVVTDIENSSSCIEEKINQYESIIKDIQEKEAALALAFDKGQKIASEGAVADRNSITEQLQSLKIKLQNLRISAEEQREKHQVNLSEHFNLKEELGILLKKLHENETLLKSRPLLDRDPDSVVRQIQKHDQIAFLVQDQLVQAEKLCSISSVGLPPSLLEMIADAQSLVASLPSELHERKKYLTVNKALRLDFNALELKFNEWKDEAETRLQSENDGVHFKTLKLDLEETQRFLENTSSVKDLVSKQIQHIADQIWPSLNTIEQQELNGVIRGTHETLANCLQALNCQLNLMKTQLETWTQYRQQLEKLITNINAARVSDATIDNVNDLQEYTTQVAINVDNLKKMLEDVDIFNQTAQNIIRQSDDEIRGETERDIVAFNQSYENMLAVLQKDFDHCVTLLNQWNEIRAEINILEEKASVLEQRVSQLDIAVKSRQQLDETKSVIQELFLELEKHKESCSKAKKMSGTLLEFLGSKSKSSADEIDKRLQNIVEKEAALASMLAVHAKRLDEQLFYIESVFKNLSRLQDSINNLLEELNELDVFDTDVESTVSCFVTLTDAVEKIINEGKHLIDTTKLHYTKIQKILPSDVQQELIELELLNERLQVNLENMGSEIELMSSMRDQYFSVIEQIQKWMKNAEIQINNRSIEPIQLKEIINNLICDAERLTDCLEKAKVSGKVITDKTRNYDEKKLIEKTLNEITKQLSNSRNALTSRKQLAEDCIDAWARFLNLYQMVMGWVAEKESFVEQPLEIATLLEAKEKVDSYSCAVSTVKVILKYISEMRDILELVLEVSMAEDLKKKLQVAEESKIRVETILLQKHGLLQEMTEEWEQCEKKVRDIRVWVEKTKSLKESLQQRKKPLRDQLGFCEKSLSDINVQKIKLALSIEKLEVHFRSGVGSDARICRDAQEVTNALDELSEIMKINAKDLEAALKQVDAYQQHIQTLRLKMIEEEHKLRTLLIPNNVSAQAQHTIDPQISQQNIKCMQMKIMFRKDRISDIIKRGVPDESFENI